MAKKTKAKKLPKRIAGVKVPKKLRKSGGKLLAVADTPAARELLTAGLVAAGSAIAARRMAHAHAPGADVGPTAGATRKEDATANRDEASEPPEEMGARMARQAVQMAGGLMASVLEQMRSGGVDARDEGRKPVG